MKKAKRSERWILGGVVPLIFSISAKASGPLCATVFSDVHFSKMDDKVTDKQVAVFKKVIDDLNASLGGLAVPKGAEIQVFIEHSAPVADPLEMSVKAGVRYVNTIPSVGIARFKSKPKNEDLKNYYKTPSFSVPILAHEYGHLIFNENYGPREPIWRDTIEGFKKLLPVLAEKNQELDAIELEVNKVFGQMSGEMTPEKRIGLIVKINELQNEAGKISDEIFELQAPFKGVFDRISPYNEFFADVVAVLYTGNSGIIDRSVSFTRKMQGNNIYTKGALQSDKERDFKNQVKHDEDYEEHGYFSLVRNGVWDSYLASPSNRTKKRGEIMEAIFSAVAGETSRVIRNPTPVFMKAEATWKELNRSLLEAIDREMAVRGIKKLK